MVSHHNKWHDYFSYHAIDQFLKWFTDIHQHSLCVKLVKGNRAFGFACIPPQENKIIRG